MSTFDSMRNAHLGFSESDWRYREWARNEPECLCRRTYAVLDRPNPLLVYRLQSWPTFVRRELIEEVSAMSVGLSKLIRSLPGRVFNHDAKEIDRFYGIGNPIMTEMALKSAAGIAGALSRGDLIATESGFKCIEWNFLASLGGWESHILADIHRSITPTARFIAEQGIEARHHNTIRSLFSHVISEVEASPGLSDSSIHIAMVTDATFKKSAEAATVVGPHFQNELDKVCCEKGIRGRTSICTFDNFHERSGRLQIGTHPVDAVIEFTSGIITPLVYRNFVAGKVRLYNGPACRVLSDKRNIALLSELAESPMLRPEERHLIRSHVPWTRMVREGTATFRGESGPLGGILEAEREDLVLKSTLASGGKGVVVGRYVGAGEWNEVCRRAFAEPNWLVQEFVDSLPYLYQNGERGCSPHDLNWGPFVFGDRYAGSILRLQPKEDRSVINLTQTATMGLIFEVDESGPRRGARLIRSLEP